MNRKKRSDPRLTDAFQQIGFQAPKEQSGMRAERQILFWLTAALLLVLLIGLLKAILLPFVAGIAIAYFLSPVADRLVTLGLNRIIASLLIVLAGGVVVVVLAILVVPLLVAQAQEIAVAVPGEIQRLREPMEAWVRERLGPVFPGIEGQLARAGDVLTQNWTSIAGWAATSVWGGSLAIFNFLALMLVTPLVVFYLLVDWHPMLAKIDGWLPRDYAPSIRALASDMNEAISAFVRGQGTVCLILGIFYALSLSFIGLNYGLLVGLATGLFAFVPFVGWALGFITATTIALVQSWPELTQPLLVVGVFAAGQALDAGFLSPSIVGSKIGLHPVWLIFALFAFSYLFGFVGTLVAVPVAAALAVLIRFALSVYLQSPVYKGGTFTAPSPAPRPTVETAP
jgi:predicted PurR-regulated permease PerM